MNIKKKCATFCSFVILILVLLVLFSNYKLKKIEKYADVFSVNFQKELTNDEGNELFHKICQQENTPVVIWGQESNAHIANVNLVREYTAEKISVYGQPTLLFPDIDVTYFNNEDKNGCIIDEKAAYELFGNINVEGKAISYDSQDYMIRAVIKGERGLFIIHGSGDTDIFQSINFTDVDSAKYEALRTGYETTYEIIGNVTDYQFFIDCSHLLCWFSTFLFIISGWYFFSTWKRNKKEGSYYIQIFIQIIVICTVIVLALKRFPVSQNLIPTKWSDFAFWRELFNDKLDCIINFVKMKKSIYELSFMKLYFEWWFYNFVINIILILYLIYRLILIPCRRRLIPILPPQNQ